MITVGITGRSGCGKSTVSAYYQSLGYPLADSDLVAKQIMDPGSPCLQQLCEAFGSDILDESGALRRRLLADRAFATPEGTQTLTNITHPEILRRILAMREDARQNGADLFFIDGAVLVGSVFEQFCDILILVAAPFEVSVQRICKRDGISPEMAMRRLNAQLSEETLRNKASYILENNQTLECLIQQAQNVLPLLRKEPNA